VADDNGDSSGKSNRPVQVTVALIGALATVSVAVVANWHSIFPGPKPAAAPGANPVASNLAGAPAAGPAPAPAMDPGGSSAEFILPQSDQNVLTPADLALLSAAQLRLARNEIYARHGRVFASADLRAYFGRQPWYRPSPGAVATLSTVEQQNVALLQQAEQSRGA
jgi:YARHG domain